MMNRIITFLKRWRQAAIRVAGGLLLVHAGYLIVKAVAVEPDQGYLAAEQAKQDQSAVKFDQKTIDAVKKQINLPISTDLNNLGKGDPFNP